MTVVALAPYRRDRVFAEIAETVTRHGLAVGCPDESGRPRVLAAVIPVRWCRACGQDMPGDHPHTTSEEVDHG